MGLKGIEKGSIFVEDSNGVRLGTGMFSFACLNYSDSG